MSTVIDVIRPASRTIDVIRPAGRTVSIATPDSALPVERIWRKEGAADLETIWINADAEPAHTASIVNGNLKIASGASNTDGNRRTIWALPRKYRDMTMHSIVHEPSHMDPAICSPQIGHAMRIVDNGDGTSSAFVFDSNVYGNLFTTVWNAVWTWSNITPPATGSLTISDLATTVSFDLYSAQLVSTLRTNAGSYYDVLSFQEPSKFVAGDHVTVSGATDSTYNQTSATVILAGPAGAYVSTSQTTTKPLTVSIGTVTYVAPTNGHDPRTIYPQHFLTRVVGNVAMLKTWPVDAAEPDWQKVIDYTGDSTATVPNGPGRCGLIVNHLHGAGEYVQYGDVTIQPA